MNAVVAKEVNQSGVYIGIDLGGTQLRVAAIDENGHILENIKMLTNRSRGYQAVIDDMITASLSLKKQYAVSAVGVIAPGPLDARNGVIHAQPTLPDWDAVPLKAMLEEGLGLPVSVENDANGAALGEALLGAGKGFDSVFYITVSTGVGGGFVYKNQLISGAHNCAGEISNMIITNEGPTDTELNTGALESLASGTALIEQASRLGVDGPAELLKMKEQRNKFVDHLSSGIANIIHTVDPDIIVIGGGVTNSAELYWQELKEAVNGKVYNYLRDKTLFSLAALDGNAGIIGAALLAQSAVLSKA